MTARGVTFSELGFRGRLGNQLWQIAAVIGRSLALDWPIRLPPWSFSDAFAVPSAWFTPPEDNDAEVYELVDYLNPLDMHTVQDTRLWWDYQEDVRKYLSPAAHVVAEADVLYGGITGGDDATAVHIRRGDYLDYPYAYPLPSADYYRKATENADIKDIIVFTNDPDWVAENMSFLSGVRMTSRPANFIDLAGMARCRRHVIANSSFSWWGAFLSGSSEVIYPREWYTAKFQTYMSTYIVPAHWTPLD